MKSYRLISFVMFFALSTGICLAQIDTQKTLGNLDITAIQKMQVEKSGTGFTLRVVTILSNDNAESLRLRNGEFEVSFDRGPKLPPIVIGRTALTSQDFPGKKGDQGGTGAMELVVAVGPNNPETLDRILAMYNIVGDPESNLKMVVKGRAEVGLQLPRGWVFEQGRKVELELNFSPQVQRIILLK
jgi:hypothetical protein